MDDFQYCLKELQGIETAKSDINTKMAEVEEGTADYEKFQKQLEALDKADTFIRDSIQTKFENQITKYQNYIDDTNVAITENATRGSRLDLISTRLQNQKTTFKELQTDNEDIDVTEVAVELSSSQLTYQAALMATSKIMQTNLMNYI
jgi:flagellar hook-associated protein 3 FlgL